MTGDVISESLISRSLLRGRLLIGKFTSPRTIQYGKMSIDEKG